MIEYSRRALKALVHLFSAYNDIDIYVEDRTSHRVYQLLCDKYLDGRARVVRVFGVGDRQGVLEACRTDQGPGGRPRLYIIDGDFDFVLDRPPPHLGRFHRLNCYTMENLLWCAVAISEVAADCLGLPDSEEVGRDIGLLGIMKEVVERLGGLAITYAAVNEHAPEIETSGRNVHSLCVHRHGRPVLAPSKIDALRAELEAELRNRLGDERAVEAMREVRGRVPAAISEIAKRIPGKTHLLPPLYHFLRVKVGLRDTLEQFKVRIARHLKSTVDADLQRALWEVARG